MKHNLFAFFPNAAVFSLVDDIVFGKTDRPTGRYENVDEPGESALVAHDRASLLTMIAWPVMTRDMQNAAPTTQREHEEVLTTHLLEIADMIDAIATADEDETCFAHLDHIPA